MSGKGAFLTIIVAVTVLLGAVIVLAGWVLGGVCP